MSSKDWTEEQVNYLRQHYATTPHAELEAALQRSRHAVAVKAVRLGLHKEGRPGYVFPAHLRRYRINPQAFDTLIPGTAYVLGFILADGSICQTRTPSLTWRLKISNRSLDILTKIRVVLESDHPITLTRKGRHTGYDLVIVNKEMVDGLRKRGITPNKSLTATLPSVPDDLFADFLRGYFDGDGSVRITSTGGLAVKFTSGSPSLLSAVAERVCKLMGVSTRLPVHDKGRPNAWRLYYFGARALRLADYMYENAGTLFLSEKRAVFDRFRAR
jgi:hypothetical protein